MPGKSTNRNRSKSNSRAAEKRTSPLAGPVFVWGVMGSAIVVLVLAAAAILG